MSKNIEEKQRELFKEKNEQAAMRHNSINELLKINPIIEFSANKLVGEETVEGDDGEFERKLKYEEVEGSVNLKEIQAQVQKELDLMNTYIFSDDVFEKEAALRKWIRTITCKRHLNISDAEELIKLAKVKEANDVFIFHGVQFIVTQLGMLDRFDRYIYSLESTIINLQKQNTVYNELVVKYNSQSFFGYVKLAFSALFKRRN